MLLVRGLTDFPPSSTLRGDCVCGMFVCVCGMFVLADLLLTIGFAVFSTFRIEGSWDPGDYGLTESSSSSTIATSSNASDDDDDDDDEDMLDPSGVGEKTEASEDLMENRVVSSIDEIADGTVSDHSDDGNTDEADDSTTHANTRAPPPRQSLYRTRHSTTEEYVVDWPACIEALKFYKASQPTRQRPTMGMKVALYLTRTRCDQQMTFAEC